MAALTQRRNAFLDFLVNFLFLTVKSIDIYILDVLSRKYHHIKK